MKTLLIALSFALLAASSASAITVLAYDIRTNGSSTSRTDVTGVSANPLAVGPGAATAGTNGFGADGFTATSSAAADAAGDFISFGFTSDTEITLDTLTLRVSRNPQGPQQVLVDVQLDGALRQVIATAFDPGRSSGTLLALDLSALGSARNVTFRLLGWNANNASGQFTIASGTGAIALTGSPVPVPLPAGGAALLGALGLVALLRRSRRAPA